MSSHGPIVSKLVVKIGGSLLLRPDLGTAIENWLERRLERRLSDPGPEMQVNLVVGGGAIIDAIRQLDAIHSLDRVSLHWQCIAALRQTSEIVAGLIPNCVVIDSRKSFDAHRRSTATASRFVIIPDTFYHRASGDCLPCDWTTTSDSVAALLAKKIGADQLVLLKSCNIPAGIALREAARRDIIDPVLPTIIEPHRVELAKLL